MKYSLIIPILNKPEVLKQLLLSMDESEIPELIYIVDNSAGKHTEELDSMLLELSVLPQFAKTHFTIPMDIETNIGVPASWNLGMQNTPAPWVISNFDMTLPKGTITALLQPLEYGYDIVTLDRGYCLFALSESIIGKIGYFDKNFFPAYIEDSDYDRRVHLHPNVTKHVVALPDVQHGGSLTVRDHHGKPLGDALAECSELNGIYYRKKWGGGVGNETLKTPFGKEEALSYWEIDKDLMTYKFAIWKRNINKDV